MTAKPCPVPLQAAPRWTPTPRTQRSSWSKYLGLALLAACNLPRDPESTRDRVHDGVLRVGVIEDAPWASRDAHGRPRGVEVELTEALAHELGAELRWNFGGETRLMAALGDFELDLVIGGLDDDSPYREHAAFTRPYYVGDGRPHVLAAPPGENAWLMSVERFLGAHHLMVPASLLRARLEEADR